jgi:hypothetical protein
VLQSCDSPGILMASHQHKDLHLPAWVISPPKHEWEKSLGDRRQTPRWGAKLLGLQIEINFPAKIES